MLKPPRSEQGALTCKSVASYSQLFSPKPVKPTLQPVSLRCASFSPVTTWIQKSAALQAQRQQQNTHTIAFRNYVDLTPHRQGGRLHTTHTQPTSHTTNTHTMRTHHITHTPITQTHTQTPPPRLTAESFPWAFLLHRR